MNVIFTVAGIPYDLPLPDGDELPDVGREIHEAIGAASGESNVDKHLEARIFEGLLDALVEERDLDLGEVTDGADNQSSDGEK